MIRTGFLILTCTVALAAAPVFAQWKPDDARGVRFSPERRPFSEERMAQIKLPPGFQINVFAQLEGEPRMMEVAPDGTVYITQRKAGKVTALRDTDGDGRVEVTRTVVSGLDGVHGIDIHDDTMYLATADTVFRAPVQADGGVGEPKKIADIPGGRAHLNRTLEVGPDGKLYITVGSTCNACVEDNPKHAAILRSELDGSSQTIYARGLRNTIGFGFHPGTKQLWGMDHGSDWRGDNQPPEELNRLTEGGDYGWPFVFGNRNIDPLIDASPPGGLSKQEYAEKTVPSVLEYQAHSAPLQMAFYTGEMFPADYRGDAFVAMRGSWNRKPPSGYKVVRIKFDNGKPVDFEDFAANWLVEDETAHFGRLAGVAVAKDGALLVGDDTNGVIYRISYNK